MNTEILETVRLDGWPSRPGCRYGCATLDEALRGLARRSAVSG